MFVLIFCFLSYSQLNAAGYESVRLTYADGLTLEFCLDTETVQRLASEGMHANIILLPIILKLCQ